MDARFVKLIDDLADPSQSLPEDRLHLLSDIDATQASMLTDRWTAIPTERRLALIDRIGKLADGNFELTFERINRFAMTDPDELVRRAAIRNLWECEDPGLARSLLAALLDDASNSVRAAAAGALGQFVYLGEVDEVETGLLSRIEDSLLHSASRDDDEGVRLRSLESLGYSSRSEVPGLIERAFDSDDEPQVHSALKAMGRSANTIWQEQVVSQLNNPAPILRAESVRASGELELQAAVQDLIDLTEDADQEVRRAAIWSLAQLGGTRAGETLTRLLETAQNPDDAALLEDAVDYLGFVDGTRDIALVDFDSDEDLSA
jgi:HEAT repeat protein